MILKPHIFFSTAAITQCPVGKTIEKVTLVGGIQAGNFRDHGKVKDMTQCRRICCEIPKCNLAFILAGNCFSVECKNVELCKTQPSKPSKFAPQISYVRAFGSTKFLGVYSYNYGFNYLGFFFNSHFS